MENHDEIVISGISGRFPECNNVEEFKEALMKGKDLVTVNEKRYPKGFKNFPEKNSVIPEIDKFDAVFFKMSPIEAKYTNPRHRILLEAAYESIFDAGYNPEELKGSKTGVFVAMGMTRSQTDDILEDSYGNSYLGQNNFHAANRISYAFDFKGTSFAMDSACSSSLYAFSNAFSQLRAGEIDHALVLGANLTLNIEEVEEFNKMNVLSDACRVFNKDRSGFAVGEAVVSYFLSRKSNSRRVYATVLCAKTNVDGFKKEGIISPSPITQSVLMKEVYEEAKISMDDITYIELHGTGTQVGDVVECQSILDVFGQRKQPVLVGSVKSNVGHTLQASGLVGMTKVILAMESRMIPQNLYTDNIDITIPGIGDEKIQIVKTNTPYNDGIMGVNSFGIGGANAHVALKPNGKRTMLPLSDIDNRLVQVSGRTEDAVNYFLDEIEKNQNEKQFLALIDEIHKMNIEGHCYRGYSVLGKTPKREISKCKSGKRPVWFIYSGMGSQWSGMGRALMHIQVFRDTFNRCAEAVKPYGVNLENIIMKGSAEDLEDVENCFCAIIAISVSLTDLLTSLGIQPDFMAGHSLGEIGCAYSNGDLTPEQAVLLAYSRGYACKQTTLPLGQMAAIGMSNEELKTILPKDIYIVCQNSKDNITISGPQSSVKKFTEELTHQGVFNKLVDTANIAFHSKYLMDADKYMLEFLKKVLPDPKPRLNKWISTSVPPEQKGEIWAQYNSAEYHVFNFMNTVLFDEIYQHIEKNAIIIEIAPHGLLRSILRREIGPDNTLICLMNKTAENQEQFLLSSIGQIFLSGVQPNLRNLYKDVSFPVSRGTKMLSPLIKWDHSASYSVPKVKPEYFGKIVTVNISHEKHEFLKGHDIDGRILMPAAAYLELVWSVLAEKVLKKMEDLPVIFEDIRFERSTVLPDNETVQFLVNIFRDTGHFEIFESRSVVCSGKITATTNVADHYVSKEIMKMDDNVAIMKREDVYKELMLGRYYFKGPFKSISETDIKGYVTKVEWFNNFIILMDSMMQVIMIATGNQTRDLMLPTTIKKFIIDPTAHLEETDQKYNTLLHDPYLNLVKSKGLELFDLKLARAPKRQKTQVDPVLQSYEFVNYNSLKNESYNFETSFSIAVQIILQNISGLTKYLSIAEVLETETSITEIENNLPKQTFAEIEYNKVIYIKIDNKYETIIINQNIADKYSINNFSKYVKQDGFIIYCGDLNYPINQLDIIFQTPHLSLLRLKQTFPALYDTINIRNSDFKWLKKLQNISKSSKKMTLFLFSQNEKNSGLIGLTNCLSREDTKVEFKAVLIDQGLDVFSADSTFYRDQLSKNLTFNILKNSNWGTYVHVPLGEVGEKIVKNAKVSVKTLGDMSTLSWVEMPGFLPKDLKLAAEIVDVKYMALNFRDTLVATGDLHVKFFEPSDDNTKLGYEYSGITKSGRRVMGMIFLNEFNTELQADCDFTWDVPSRWTLEEAATVPIVYATCYYALIIRGQMAKGNSILIHAGSGGIGMAAIRIALSLKATIFTTVGSQKKKEFLLKTFPDLEEGNIGNSRDTTFFNLIKTKTKGKGLDIILNSLAGELFQTSLNLMAPEGKFLELGVKDFASGSKITSGLFLNNCTVHGVFVDKLFEDGSQMKRKIFEIVKKGIETGVVKPLPTTVFEKTQLEEAWRFLASGKHIGKVLIKLSDEETTGPVSVSAIPRIKFNPEKVFIIIGGLGGMGMELASWLLTKGVRKMILNGRRNVWNGYQSYNIAKWQSYKDVIIKIDQNDSSKYEEAEKLILDAKKLGNIGGIFNIALVLRDNAILNQSPSDFEEAFTPKIRSCENLDRITRRCCPHLEHFVVFSSIVSSRGNIGQTNYGMTNSAMERLCEYRRKDNLPGLAVQWGPVGDVGVLITDVAFKQESLGLEPQGIDSCLNALEKFMIKDVVVGSSVILAENRKTGTEGVTEKTPANIVAHILGIENIESIDGSKKLYEFGLDSLMVSEIKQTLYRHFLLEYDKPAIRELSFDYLVNLKA